MKATNQTLFHLFTAEPTWNDPCRALFLVLLGRIGIIGTIAGGACHLPLLAGVFDVLVLQHGDGMGQNSECPKFQIKMARDLASSGTEAPKKESNSLEYVRIIFGTLINSFCFCRMGLDFRPRAF